MFVGIDVAKDRLDVHLRPAGEAFTVARDGEGIEALVDRLAALKVELVVLEATGGFETVVAAGLAAVGLPLAVVNPRQIRDFARAPAARRRPIRSMPRRSPTAPKRCGPRACRQCRSSRARRTRRAPPPTDRDDDRRAQPPAPTHHQAAGQGHRSHSGGAPGPARRTRTGHRRAARGTPAWHEEEDLLAPCQGSARRSPHTDRRA